MKHFLRIFILLLCFAFATVSQAQRPTKSGFTITGTVIDNASGNPLEFATVAAYAKSDSSVLEGTLTDNQGKFNISVNTSETFIQIEFLSYQTKVFDNLEFSGQMTDLGVIIMEVSGETLEEVEIVAEVSETRFALDKKVFTVGKDLANRGGTAEDILDNVPSVTVDIEGNVSLRGSDGVRILIDGRPSGLAGVGNTNGLRNIASNIIEKVEVITNPSARYEAEGMAGIINIVLKKNKADGFNGSFDVTGGAPLRTGIAANINYRKNKLNWFFNYGLRYRENPGSGFIAQDQILNDSTGLSDELRQITIQDRNQTRTGLSNSFRFGADYLFNDKEQLTASFLYRKSDEDNFSTINYRDYFNEASQFSNQQLWNSEVEDWRRSEFLNFEENISLDNKVAESVRTDNEKEDESNLEYRINYEKQFSSRDHKFNASLQFRDETEIESSQFINTELFDPLTFQDFEQRSRNEEGERNWLIQLDYVHPLGEDHKFEAGLRSSLRDITNDFLVEDLIENSYVPVEGLSNNFLYDEDIHAGYLIYGNTYNKFGFQLGLRSEYTLINTLLVQSEVGGENERDFFNLFPSGHVNYKFSDRSSIQLSYSRRVRRPRFWDLNPFFTFSDNRNFFSGNPNVNPEFTDSYEVGQIQYWDDLTLSGSIFYRHTTNSIQRVLTVDNTASTTLRMPLNIGIVDDYGLDISLNYTGLDWIKLDANVNIFRNQLSLDPTETADEVYRYYQTVRNYSAGRMAFDEAYSFEFNETDNITWNGRITARIDAFNSDFQIRSNYRGPRETSQGASNGILTVDIGWSKDFLDKKMTVTLGIRDLFNQRRRNGYTLLDDFYQYSEFQWRARSADITLSYRINQKKKFERDSNGGEGFDDGEF